VNDDIDPAPVRDTLFMRVAAFVGDLGSPFYDEERRRDVWNEASAVGLQIVLWLGTLAATVAVWLVGADAVPYALTIFAIAGLAGLVTITYATRLGVEVDHQQLATVRLVPYTVLLTLFSIGIARSGIHRDRDSAWESFQYGAIQGASVTWAILTVVFLVMAVRARRHRAPA
jgi:hypothetical protein